MSGIKKHLLAHWPVYLNIYLFLNVILYTVWMLRDIVARNSLGLSDISFVLQNVILCAVLLARTEHVRIERSYWKQAVALVAFCSGVLMLGYPEARLPELRVSGTAIVLLANVFGIFTLLNLGRSFGILIAERRIKTGGLYAYIRHPMYASDILLRLGYLAGHPGWLPAFVMFGSVAIYVWRARLEEAFLGQDPQYAEYVKRVPYRFIPFVA